MCCLASGLEKPLVLLSGHDTTLMPLLRSMDIFNERWPPYCADIAIELYQDETGKKMTRMTKMTKLAVAPMIRQTLNG
jgi:hypothetical protein